MSPTQKKSLLVFKVNNMRLFLYMSLLFFSGRINAEERVFNTKTLKEFKIKNLAGTVEISSQPKTEVKVIYVHKKPELFSKFCTISFAEKGSKIAVKTSKNSQTIGDPCETNFQIFLPIIDKLESEISGGKLILKGSFKTIKTEIGGGDVEFDGSASNFDIEVGAGNFSGKGNFLEKISLKTGSGNIKLALENKSETPTAYIDLGTGNSSITYSHTPESGSLYVQTGFGNTDISLPKSTKAEFDLSSGMGERVNEFQNFKKSNFKVKTSNPFGNLNIRKKD